MGSLQALVIQTSEDLDLKKAVGTFQGAVFYKNAPQKHLIIQGVYKLQGAKLILEATHLQKIPPNKKLKPTTHPLSQVQATQNLGTMRLKKIAKGSKIYFKEPNLQKMASLLGVDYAQYVASQKVPGILNPTTPTPSQSPTSANPPTTQTNPTNPKTLSSTPKTSTPRSYQRSTRKVGTRTRRSPTRSKGTSRRTYTSKSTRSRGTAIRTGRTKTPSLTSTKTPQSTPVAQTHPQTSLVQSNPATPPAPPQAYQPSPPSSSYTPSYIPMPLPESNFVPSRSPSPTTPQTTPTTKPPPRSPRSRKWNQERKFG